MTEKFTASNGVEVEFDDERGRFRFTEGDKAHDVWTDHAMNDALREYFLHEQGVWRDLETGALVVRTPWKDDHDGRAVAIIGEGILASGRWEKLSGGPTIDGIKGRYFAAHSEPKAWHDAVEGEVWELEVEGVDDRINGKNVWTVRRHTRPDGTIFRPVKTCSVDFIGVKATAIKSGRRIYPEADG